MVLGVKGFGAWRPSSREACLCGCCGDSPHESVRGTSSSVAPHGAQRCVRHPPDGASGYSAGDKLRWWLDPKVGFGTPWLSALPNVSTHTRCPETSPPGRAPQNASPLAGWAGPRCGRSALQPCLAHTNEQQLQRQLQQQQQGRAVRWGMRGAGGRLAPGTLLLLLLLLLLYSCS